MTASVNAAPPTAAELGLRLEMVGSYGLILKVAV